METKPNFSHRLGSALNKARRGWVRLENRLGAKLASRGWPSWLAKVIYLPVLAILLLLFFIAVKSLLIILFLFLGAFILANSDSSEEEPESSYTFGDDDPRNELGYDPNFYNDVSHEQYVDEKE